VLFFNTHPTVTISTKTKSTRGKIIIKKGENEGVSKNPFRKCSDYCGPKKQLFSQQLTKGYWKVFSLLLTHT
jgi:hypothetical protein